MDNKELNKIKKIVLRKLGARDSETKPLKKAYYNNKVYMMSRKDDVFTNLSLYNFTQELRTEFESGGKNTYLNWYVRGDENTKKYYQNVVFLIQKYNTDSKMKKHLKIKDDRWWQHILFTEYENELGLPHMEMEIDGKKIYYCFGFF